MFTAWAGSLRGHANAFCEMSEIFEQRLQEPYTQFYVATILILDEYRRVHAEICRRVDHLQSPLRRINSPYSTTPSYTTVR